MAGPKSVCTFEKTFSVANLKNLDSDPCLEANPFVPISESAVETIKGTAKSVEATWYGGENNRPFQWAYTLNEHIFNTYDYTIACGYNLRKKYPLGSLVRITLPETGASVIARVTDQKEKNGAKDNDNTIDLSKTLVHKLGGYNLLKAGRFKVNIESVKIKGTDNKAEDTYLNESVKSGKIEKQYKHNSFLLLGRWEYDKEKFSPDYIDNNRVAFTRLLEVADYLKRNVPGYDGWPRPHLVLVHGNKTSGANSGLFIELRIGPLISDKESKYYEEKISPLKDSGQIPELKRVTEKWPKAHTGRMINTNPHYIPSLPEWKQCSIVIYHSPFSLNTSLKRIQTNFKNLPPNCIKSEGKNDKNYLLILSANQCFNAETNFLDFYNTLASNYMRTLICLEPAIETPAENPSKSASN